MTAITVIGGGITGLAAAYELTRNEADVTLYEASDRVGGKVATTPVGGVWIDAGADAFLARVPWAVELCRELGLGDALVTPASGTAYILSGGQLRGIPAGSVLGVPTDFDALAASGLVSPEGVERARADLVRPADAPQGPETVGELVRRRMGDEVLERIVGPLLGGVNAGDADELDLETGAAQLAAAARADASLVRGLQTLQPSPGPVFYGVVGGMERVVQRLAEDLGDRIVTGARVEDVEDLPGPVIVTTPAPQAAAVLARTAPEAAELLRSIDYASVAMVTYRWPRAGVDHPLDASGFLVDPNEGLLMTACSWASSKWDHVGSADEVVFRVSAGRYDDTCQAGMCDEDLVAKLAAELGDVVGLRGQPTAVRVGRWPHSLPQYRRGHGQLVDSIEHALQRAAPTVHVAGAAYRGLGLPACIHQGRAAASAALRA